ncbi:VOC family protein [Nocardia crassostreae]|uniref:VOC family protein n=1 Tax=Nocardia crassostreae TaxID=53428 RepID=UPI000835836D|nr:VOC family protein [Nocardia crassostreae]
MTGIGRLATAAIMCDDPPALAEFYGRALGWQIVAAEDDYAWIAADETGVGLVFGRSRDYRRPDWPQDELPFHIDLYVDDLAQAEMELISLGATKPEFQPSPPDTLIVLLDPSGQPFCISPTPPALRSSGG